MLKHIDLKFRSAKVLAYTAGFALYIPFLVFAFAYLAGSLLATDPRVLATTTVSSGFLFLLIWPIRFKLRNMFRKLERNPLLAVLIVGLLALAINVVLGTFVHSPIPGVRDEFSYLLAADTFANGRLTNDTHPLWEHFRSAHIFHQPTYQSKYPPAQSAVLAFGQAFFGSPAVGVWLSIAIGSAALLWMLQAWLPARWALLGAFLFLVNFEVFKQWGQSYWGGAVALIGGALVFGALPRLLRSPRASYAIILGIGVVILAFSRPLEGLLACIPVFAVMTLWMYKSNSPPMTILIRSLVIPIAAVGVLGAALMAHYNYSVTANPLQMPYQVWLNQQGIGFASSLVSAVRPQGERLPGYTGYTDYPVIVAPDDSSSLTTTSSAMEMKDQRTPLAKLARQYKFYVGIVFGIPLLFVPLVIRTKWTRFAAITCIVVLIGVYTNGTAGFAHYLSPIAGLISLLLIQGVRYVNALRFRTYKPGRALVQLLPIFAVCLFITSITINWVQQPVSSELLWSSERANMQKTLEKSRQKHLVLVRYSAGHHYAQEWVYNASDIDNSAVVWARELAADKNENLLEYFKDRQVWLLEADATVNRELVPYPGEASSQNVHPALNSHRETNPAETHL